MIQAKNNIRDDDDDCTDDDSDEEDNDDDDDVHDTIPNKAFSSHNIQITRVHFRPPSFQR